MIDNRSNRGFHPVLDPDFHYTFVDACVQIWPDADFAVAHRHGVAAYGVTAWMPWEGLDGALEGLMNWHAVARSYPNLVVATTVEDIRRAKAEGKAALIIATQGGDFVGNKLHRVEAFYRLGLRMMILAYSSNNALAGGALDRTDEGLSALGVRVIEECGRLGIVLDLAHMGRCSTMEAMARSPMPVVFSHANCLALVDNPRNIDDEQIRTCVTGGGVIGVCNWGPLLLKAGSGVRPTVHDMLAHIDHIAQLTGTCAGIGIGTDFSLGSYALHDPDLWGPPALKNSMADYNRLFGYDTRSPLRFCEGFSCYPEIVEFVDLACRHGYRDEDIRGILGENLLRVFGQVWGG